MPLGRRAHGPPVVAVTNQRAAAALALGVLLVYAPSLGAPVIYDDAAHVRDKLIFALEPARFWPGLFSRDYFLFAAERTYQPLVTAFHYLTHSAPLVYRLFGLAVHVLNAALVYLVARRLDLARRPALLAAGLFAFFPAHTELLNFSAFKGHLFAASFTLAVLLEVMRRDERGRASPRTLAVCGLLMLGLFSKETGLVAVGLSALYALFNARADIRRFAGPAAACAAVSAAYLWWRFVYLTPPPAFPVRFEHSSWASLAFYLRTLLVPFPLCLERTLPAGPWWALWLGGFAAVAAFLRKSREDLFVLVWIVASLLPFLHLISFSNVSPVADRYLYLAAGGFCLLLVRRLGRSRRGEYALAGLLVIWAGLTASRNVMYRSTRALFEQTASCAPQNPRAHFLLGMVCFREKDYPAARAAYERVLTLTDSPGARAALADIDREEKALRLSPAARPF